MTNGNILSAPSVFRTRSWVQAWIDTWGKHPGVELIDLGGRGEPLETLFKTRHWIKGCIPARTLCLAGVGTGTVSTPRAEYNHMDEIMMLCGGVTPLMQELGKLGWDQFLLPDILVNSRCHHQIQELSDESGWSIHTERDEPAYCIESQSFEQYCARLSASVRRTYFHQRRRLETLGNLQREHWTLDQLEPFIQTLNQLHSARWGRPCYNAESTRFLRRFSDQFHEEGGQVVMDVMRLEGRVISVLLDIIWQNTRYNLQSGYEMSGYQGLSLGSLHIGYGIEDALLKNLRYDCLAGQGKSTDYKRRIANKAYYLQTIILQKPPIAALRKINRMLSTWK